MKASSGSSVQRVYFALAFFNVGTLVVSLFLGHQLMSVYRGSVEVNEQWAERLSLYARLGQLVTEANAPGNDVFVDKDVAGQRARLETITREVEQTFSRAEVDLSTLATSEQATLSPRLADARREFRGMQLEANAIFDSYGQGDVDAAGTHMGQMDQAFARTSAALDGLRTEVQHIQSSAFVRQLEAASKSQSAQYALMALVVLMVAAVVAYGFRLQRTMSRKQAEIDRANEGMRLVLDNVEQGLLTVDLSARVVGERSEAVGRWLPTVTAGTVVWRALAPVDQKCAQWLEAGWSLITEDVMPLEVAIEQLPRRLRLGDQVLSIGYRPIFEGGRLSRMLLVLTDVTAAVRSERLELQQRETLSMFERVMRDRSGFVEAFDDCGRLVSAVVMLGDRDLTVVRRQVHTLKGNAASIGLASLASTCHELEDYLTESAGDLSRPMVERLRQEWDALSLRLHSLMGQHSHAEVVVEPEAFEALLDAVTTEEVPRSSVRTMVESLRMEPASRRLERLAEQAQSVAGRVMKGPLHVVIESNGLRFDRERWTPFFSSLVHLVRNAVDHGLETLSDRVALGKGVGTLTFTTKVTGDQLELCIADDGRGIDLERLVAVARARGLVVRDGVEAMFLDGISSRDEVTDLSGRGVGMAAVKAATEAMGGRLSVDTRAGVGTTFRFMLPLIGVGAELSRRATPEPSPRQELRLVAPRTP
ncbi:MAG: ATP-binding protein [Myxococcaceae bacterium]